MIVVALRVVFLFDYAYGTNDLEMTKVGDKGKFYGINESEDGSLR